MSADDPQVVLDELARLIRDTDEKIMRVGEDDHEGEFPRTIDTYQRLLDDLMCRLVNRLDLFGETVCGWHDEGDCRWDVLPEFAKPERPPT